MKTISAPPVVKRREVRVHSSNMDARLSALESTVGLMRFWVSLALTLTAIFGTLAFVALAWWYTGGGK